MQLRRRFVAVAAALVLVAAACGDDDGDVALEEPPGEADPDLPEAPPIVATSSILGDVAVNVAGACEAEVATIMGPGVDPHVYQPSPQDAQAMRDAGVLVVNGGALEEGLLATIDAAEDDGANVFVALDAIDPIEYEGVSGDTHGHEDDDHGHGHDDDDHTHGHEDDDHGHGHDDDDHGHGHDGDDPHFWQDPARTANVALALGDRVAEIDDVRAECYRDAAAEYADELRALDVEVAELLESVPTDRRKLVTNHDAFGYLADRYGFEVVGTIIPGATTGAQTSAADLEQLARTIESEGVPAIFIEHVAPDRLAWVLAEEAAVDVEIHELYSDALGEDGSGAETYVGLVRTNAERIAGALG